MVCGHATPAARFQRLLGNPESFKEVLHGNEDNRKKALVRCLVSGEEYMAGLWVNAMK